MARSRRYDPDRDPEAESERRAPPPPDPARMAAREEYWKGEIARAGGMDGIRRGGVYRLPGFDHDGNAISREDELALDRAAGLEFPDDDPLLRE